MIPQMPATKMMTSSFYDLAFDHPYYGSGSVGGGARLLLLY
jgi:hypothetical protein